MPADFDRLRAEIDTAASADQRTFDRSAAAARDASGYLAPAVLVLTALAVAGCVIGVGTRIREYW